MSHHTIKFLEENFGSNISNIPCSNILTDMSPEARDIRERIICYLEKFKVHGCSSEKLYRSWNDWKVYFSVLKFV